MKLSTKLTMAVLALFGMVAADFGGRPDHTFEVVVALKPDKDPEAMIAERAQLSSIFPSNWANRSR